MDPLVKILDAVVKSFVRFQALTGFPEWVNAHSAVWPICEILHFVGLCLLIGSIGVFDLRLMGLAKSIPVAPLRRLLPWGVLGFVINLVTGVIFVAGNAFTPGEYLRNIAFAWKMAFILLAGANLLVFHMTGLSRKVETVGPGENASTGARFIGAVSLSLWLGVIVFGRLLPYIGDAF